MMELTTHTPTLTFLPAAKINGSVDTYNADPSHQDSVSLPHWNESASDHAAALAQATTDNDDDYPLAMDDMELSEFLRDAMEHSHAQPTPQELAACDALHILEGLPDPPMNLPPP